MTKKRLSLGISVLVIGFMVSLSLTDKANGNANVAAEPSFSELFAIADTGEQSGSEQKTAGEVFKNVQVLKDVPASKFFEVMFYMRGSLGVGCTHCHVDNTNYEKDDKPTKQAARRMIQMVRALNQGNFDGRNAVSCNTCHRGQQRPVAPLALAPIKMPGSRAANSEAKPDEAMPAVEQVFDRYVQATGGRAAQEKLATRLMKGSMLTSDGWIAPLEIYEKLPNKSFLTFILGGVNYDRSYDGASGWSRDNRGMREMRPDKMALFKRESALFRPINLKGQYVALKFIGKEMAGDRDAYVIEGTLAEEAGLEKLFFDVETGLLLRITSQSESAFGPLPQAIELEDYREVDGIKIPFAISYLRSDFSHMHKLDEVKHNVSVDDAKFSKPPSK